MATAPGIPDRTEFGQVEQLTPGQLLDFYVQEHNARRAKFHRDIRLGSPESGLYSWAARKGLPAPGQRHLAVQQPLHSHEYGGWEGEIPEGQYGAGTVKSHTRGRALVTHTSPNSLSFTTAHDRFPERYSLIRTGPDKRWLMQNTTPTQPLSDYQKVHYATVPSIQAEKYLQNLGPGSSVQPKLDAASSLVKLLKDRVEVASLRRSVSGRPIMYTEKFLPGANRLRVPPELVGSELRGELYGTSGADNRVVEPQRLGGLLNANLATSLDRQQQQRVRLHNMLFDLHRYGQQPVGHLPYAERRAKLQEVLKHLPADRFHLSEEATTPEDAVKLLHQVQSGKHPLTSEGLVIHPATGKPTKIKFRPEQDVHVRSIFSGEGKYKDIGAGGFEYSHEPDSPVVGRVGTGLSDELRRDMHADPQAYLGRVARVAAQGRFPDTGALRAPSLLSLHEDIDQAQPTARSRIATARQQRTPVQLLRQAKLESDRRNYSAKHDLVRQAVLANPSDFQIDSEAAGVAGLTHTSGFRIHLPSHVVPDVLRQPTSGVTT